MEDLSVLKKTIDKLMENSSTHPDDIAHDVEDEQEFQSPENWETIAPLDEQGIVGLGPNEELEDIIAENSREVAQGTDRNYRRLMAAFDRWLQQKGYISKDESIFSMELMAKTPLLEIAWIMEACDEVNPDGSKKLPGQHCKTYTNAMKMRSALTYGFGRIYSRGNIAWHAISDTQFRGNPSISVPVSRYMLALKRRKHASGELSMSSRAITASIIREIFEFNNDPEQLVPVRIQQTPRETTSLDNWGGPRSRLLVHAVIVLSFMCLLRSDEVVNLRIEDITILSPECVSISLTSRKTSQFGVLKPFVLWRLDKEDEHLCPVRALARWIQTTGIRTGFLFRSINKTDCASTDETKHLLSSTFLEMFRNNLIDIHKDPQAYGTHSLRRGGCQWLAKDRRWPIPVICDWGGWAKDFTHLTIVRYLISWNDDMNEAREDLFNPHRLPNVKCHRCGRTCWHA